MRMINVSDKTVEKVRAHTLSLIKFSRKSCSFLDNVEKFGEAGQPMDNNVLRRMRIASWKIKATDTHSECVFHGKNGYAKVPQCYIYVHCLSFL
jgi:hypothetical protein